MPQWQWGPDRNPEPEQSKLLMPYFGQGTDGEKSACANRGTKTIGNIPVCALSSDAVSAFPGLAGFETLSAIVNLRAWTPCTSSCLLFFFFFSKKLKIKKNIKDKKHPNSFVNRVLLCRAFLSFCPPLSVFYSYRNFGWEREREKEREIYIDYSPHVHPMYHVPICSSLPKSDCFISGKQTRRLFAGLSQTRGSLLLQPGLSIR